jgi:hypothetical protein
MNLVCGCCETPFTRAGDLPLLRGTPRYGDLICVGCGWLTPRELRDLPSRQGVVSGSRRREGLRRHG